MPAACSARRWPASATRSVTELQLDMDDGRAAADRVRASAPGVRGRPGRGDRRARRPRRAAWCTARRSARRCWTRRPLRLVCCARGGPVNVDVAAASQRGIPVTTTPGQERRGGGRADDRVRADAGPGRARGRPLPDRRRRSSARHLRGPPVLRRRAAPGTRSAWSASATSAGDVASRARALGMRGDRARPVVAAAIVAGGVEPVEPGRAAGRSPASSRCTPGPTPDNRQLIGAEAFARMPRRARTSSTPPGSRWWTRTRWPPRWPTGRLGRGRPGRGGAPARPRAGTRCSACPNVDHHPAHRRRDPRDAAPRRRRWPRRRWPRWPPASRSAPGEPGGPGPPGGAIDRLSGLPAGDGRGHRELPGAAVHRGGRAGRGSACGSGRTAEPPGVPGWAGLRRRGELAGDRRVHPGRAPAGRRDRGPGRGGGGDQHARGHRALRRRRPRAVGLPERGQPRGPRGGRADRRGRRRPDLRRGRRLGVDHLAGPAALAGPARARPAAPGEQRGHAERLDRLAAGPGARHRAVLRVQLGDVQPGPPDLVGGYRCELRPARRGAPGGGRPGHGGRRGHRGGGRADRPARPAPRWSAGGADTQLGLLGAGVAGR